MATLRTATNTDAVNYPGVTLGDLIISGGGQGYFTDIQATPGGKLFIFPGTYDFIGTFWGGTGGTQANKFLITNYGGQAELNGVFDVSGLQHAKITGKYDAVNGYGNSGYPGHDNGYAYSYGKYGIYINKPFASGSDFGMRLNYDSINGGVSTNIELEYIEISGVGYNALAVKADNTPDGSSGTMYGMKVSNCYIHDTQSGEGIYCGSNAGTSNNQHTVYLEFSYNRLSRIGLEAIQTGRLGEGSWIHHNVSFMPALKYLDGFQDDQDKTFQIECRSNNIRAEKNIFVGGQEALFRGDTNGDGTITPNTIDYININDNYFGHQKRLFSYLHPGSFSGCKWNIENNYIGPIHFQDNRKHNATERNYYVGSDNSSSVFEFTNNKVSDSKPLFASVPGNVTETGTSIESVPDPEFTNTGFEYGTDYSKFELWAPTVTIGDKIGQAITYPSGWHVFRQGKCYLALQNATQIEPEVTSGWASYWQQVTFDGNNLPADDFTLVSGSKYELLGYGLNAVSQSYPVSVPGSNQSISDTAQTTLNGSGSYDPDGTIVSYLWAQVSGPNTANIITPTGQSTIVNGLIVGNYVFRLTVTDNDSLSNSNTMNVEVTETPTTKKMGSVVLLMS